jgi:dolichol kinase
LEATITLDVSAQELLGSFVQELHDFMASFQARRKGEADWERLRQRVAQLQQRAQVMRELMAARKAEWAPRLEKLAEDLRTLSAEFHERHRARMKDLAARLAFQYEDLRRAAQSYPAVVRGFDLRKLKPVNYHRNLFHVFMGTFAVAMYELVLPRPAALVIMACLTAAVVLLESGRRLFPAWNRFFIDVVFKPIVRPRERQEINSASFYVVSLALALFLMPIRAVEVGVLVLAWADPMASIAGKRWGRVKLYRDKSWVGSLAFTAMAAGVSLAFLSLAEPGTGWAWRAAVAGMAALVGAVAELLSDRLDDNLTVLLLVSGVLTLAFF